MNKRIKLIPPLDRLSALPDSLLIKILELVNFKQAVITSALSKRWRSLWLDLPRFDFREMRTEKAGSYVSVVRTALGNRTLNYLPEFSVKFDYNYSFAPDVDAWLESIALNYKTERLNLQLCSDKYYYELPRIMSCNASLTDVFLQRCCITSPIEWPSLISLTIDDALLPQCVIDQIFSSSPVLGTLSLSNCSGYSSLEINSLSLATLKIKDCRRDGKGKGKGRDIEPLLEISAPFLKNLHIKWYPLRRTLRLKNVTSSLGYAELEFCVMPGNVVAYEEEMMCKVDELLEQLQHVPELELHLGSTIFKVVSRMVGHGLRLPRLSVGALSLTGPGDDPEEDFCCVAGLLDACPDLEGLVLDYSPIWDDGIFTWNLDAKDDLVPVLRRLKTVGIVALGDIFVDDDIEHLLSMARVILEKAIVLEKMEIHLDDCSSECSTETTQKLQSYPRSSLRAKVLTLHNS